MYCTKNITDDLYWIGGNDRRLALFENIFPVPNGVSYNSYVLLDEKTVLFDTVDKAVSEQFFENLVHALGERTLDYVIINHMEPDHCAMLKEVIMRYPDVQIVCNAKTADIIKQFFKIETDAVIVKENDTLGKGKIISHFLFPHENILSHSLWHLWYIGRKLWSHMIRRTKYYFQQMLSEHSERSTEICLPMRLNLNTNGWMTPEDIIRIS